MRIVRPAAVTEETYTATTLTPTEGAAWASGITFDEGDLVDHADHVWESLQDDNLGHEPGAAGFDTWWLDRGANNVWALFDKTVQSQSSAEDAFSVELTFPDLVDTVVILNADAAEVRVTQTDEDDGVVYDETVSLIQNDGIDSWWAFFFEPIVRVTDAVFDGLKPYIGAPIAVTFSNPGETVRAGACIPGLSLELGGTQYGVEVGIDDYSVKQVDDFGRFTVLERSYSRRARFQIWVERYRVGYLQDVLAGYRAKPLVFIGSDEDAATVVYGFYASFSQTISYPDVAVMDLEVKGLA